MLEVTLAIFRATHDRAEVTHWYTNPWPGHGRDDGQGAEAYSRLARQSTPADEHFVRALDASPWPHAGQTSSYGYSDPDADRDAKAYDTFDAPDELFGSWTSIGICSKTSSSQRTHSDQLLTRFIIGG